MHDSRNILYCSSLCSDAVLYEIQKTAKIQTLFAIQKFHGLLTKGFTSNHAHVTCLTCIPVNRKTHSKLWWDIKSENQNGIGFIYLTFINMPYLRHLLIFFFSIVYTTKWCIRNKKSNSYVICDVLNVSISLPSLIISKIFGYKTCAIVTDIPNLLYQTRDRINRTFLELYATKLSTRFMGLYDYYVLLTKQMNHIVNKNNRPYLVIEGLVDIDMKGSNHTAKDPRFERILIYAGGIYEKYGVKKLLDAFVLLKGDELRMDIYGTGDLAKEMSIYSSKDKRIRYFGVVPNKEIVQKLSQATILINPRPSDFEFTKFSFPSKNMEYMVSGTPLLTTHLPGIPEEYDDFVYYFNDETVDGFAKTICDLLVLPQSELAEKGMKARNYVLESKNNIIQASQILKLLIEV